MAGQVGSLLLLLVILALSFADEPEENPRKKITWTFIGNSQVRKCPDGIKPMKNVDKNRLLGVWFAYATTALDNSYYRRRCASYNVENNPYFKTNIMYTDYKNIVITYSCTYDRKSKVNDVKLRLLTRTRTPMRKILPIAANYLVSIDFPLRKLVFLKSVAYCFEWYILKYHQRPRPGRYAVPMNSFFEH